MSSLPNFLPLLADRKIHHTTSLLALLIASEYYFEFFLPYSNRNHVEFALAHLALDTFLCVTIHYIHLRRFFDHIVVLTDEESCS